MNRWMAVALLICAACGSDSNNQDAGSPGPGTFQGTVGGKALDVKDAVFGIITTAPAQNVVVVYLADRTGLCAALGSNPAPTGETNAFGFGLGNLTAGGVVPLVTGSYNFTTAPTSLGRFWFAGLFETVQGCTPSGSPVDASGGTVNVTQVGNTTGTNLQATFNVNLGSDAASGSVNATYCAAASSPSCGGFLRAAPPTVE